MAARNDVVQAQLGRRKLLAAELALVVVAGKDVPPIELHRVLGQPFVADQANDARHLDLAGRCPHPVVFFLAKVLVPVFADLAPGGEVVGRKLAVFAVDNLRQVLAQENKGAPQRNDVHRHEQLVEHQYVGIERGVGRTYH